MTALEESILGALWVAGVQAGRRVSRTRHTKSLTEDEAKALYLGIDEIDEMFGYPPWSLVK